MAQVQARPTTKIVPSAHSLRSQISDAMRRFDSDREQAQLRAEAREDERISRAWCAEVEAKRRRKLYGR
jgi:hypothetical protein